MKKLLFVIVYCLFGVLNAQVYNLNPDPNGDPWWAGGLPELTPEIEARIASYPFLELSTASDSLVLPDSVDNSKREYMRSIFSQFAASCDQASGIGYLYTYEINRIRDLPANNDTLVANIYPPNFTWNFLNNGLLNGKDDYYYFDGWEIAKDNGCLSGADYGNISHLYTGIDGAIVWKSGYEAYYSGMHNRVKSIYNIDATDSAGLILIKHWLNDHNEGGQAIGGLINFTLKLPRETPYGTLPAESADSGKSIILEIDGSSEYIHAMTVVGYNDYVKYDLDTSGIIG